MQSKIPIPILTVCLTLALHIAAPALAAFAADSPVDTLHASLNAYDVEGSLSAFASDAVVIQPRIGGLPPIYVGREQIRWWLRNLAAQHAQFGRSVSPEANGAHVRWSEFLSVDAFRQIGLASVEVESDVVLDDGGRIESLTTVLTPRGARDIQSAPGAASSGVVEQPGAEAVVESAGLLSAGFAGGAASVLWLTRRRQRAVASLELPAPTTS
jgi:hypothetical protein